MCQATHDTVPERHIPGSRLVGFLIWFMAAGLLLAGAVGAMLDYQHAAAVQFRGTPAGKLWLDLILAVSVLLRVGLWVFYERPRARQIARFRHAVRTQAGVGVPLIEPQPTATTVLPLPFTLRLRPRWAAAVFWSVGISALTGLFTLGVGVIAGIGHSLSIPMFMGVGFGLLALASALSGFEFNGNPAIEVTSVGLSCFAAGKAQTVLWTEANLFAVTDRDGSRHHPWALIYELASPTETIRWRCLCRPLPLAASQPAEPF
ncbi:MAG TPA: hypothetical protein VIG30_10675 [Ktedonobacterales bacterium]